MSTLNTWVISGHLGGEPVFQVTPNGNPMVKLSVAVVNYRSGGEVTMWVPVVMFGNRAETCEKYLKTGSYVMCTGRAELNEYKDREGVKRTSLSMTATDIVFGPKPKEENKRREFIIPDMNEMEEGTAAILATDETLP